MRDCVGERSRRGIEEREKEKVYTEQSLKFSLLENVVVIVVLCVCVCVCRSVLDRNRHLVFNVSREIIWLTNLTVVVTSFFESLHEFVVDIEYRNTIK